MTAKEDDMRDVARGDVKQGSLDNPPRDYRPERFAIGYGGQHDEVVAAIDATRPDIAAHPESRPDPGEELREVLIRVEWVQQFSNSRAECPWCGNYREDGHRANCSRQRALRLASPVPTDPIPEWEYNESDRPEPIDEERLARAIIEEGSLSHELGADWNRIVERIAAAYRTEPGETR
jgi:hypothetical protein